MFIKFSEVWHWIVIYCRLLSESFLVLWHVFFYCVLISGNTQRIRQGRIIHLSFGFIAAFIGAVAIPAVLESDWTAVTFLGLAATQFREVRKMERESLEKIDKRNLLSAARHLLREWHKRLKAAIIW